MKFSYLVDKKGLIIARLTPKGWVFFKSTPSKADKKEK
jgi:hypothetical protein